MKKIAIEWWQNLSNIELISLERKYGYYGHDQGVSEDEVIFMYQEEFPAKEIKQIEKYKHYKNSKNYVITGKCLIQVSDKWIDAVIYKEEFGNQLYCRSMMEFSEKFKLEE